MSRTYRDPLKFIEYDPPEFRNRIKWGLVPTPIGGPNDPFYGIYGPKGKRFLKRIYSHMRRHQDRAIINEEIRMLHVPLLPGNE